MAWKCMAVGLNAGRTVLIKGISADFDYGVQNNTESVAAAYQFISEFQLA